MVSLRLSCTDIFCLAINERMTETTFKGRSRGGMPRWLGRIIFNKYIKSFYIKGYNINAF
jgi:hypothetical protein